MTQDAKIAANMARNLIGSALHTDGRCFFGSVELHFRSSDAWSTAEYLIRNEYFNLFLYILETSPS